MAIANDWSPRLLYTGRIMIIYAMSCGTNCHVTRLCSGRRLQVELTLLTSDVRTEALSKIAL